MKVIIKIDEYLSERNSVVFKTCRLNSHKPIDEYEAKVCLLYTSPSPRDRG